MLSDTGMRAYVSRGLGRTAPAVRGGRRLPECSTSEEPGARTSSFTTAGGTVVIFAGAGHPANQLDGKAKAAPPFQPRAIVCQTYDSHSAPRVLKARLGGLLDRAVNEHCATAAESATDSCLQQTLDSAPRSALARSTALPQRSRARASSAQRRASAHKAKTNTAAVLLRTAKETRATKTKNTAAKEGR